MSPSLFLLYSFVCCLTAVVNSLPAELNCHYQFLLPGFPNLIMKNSKSNLVGRIVPPLAKSRRSWSGNLRIKSNPPFSIFHYPESFVPGSFLIQISCIFRSPTLNVLRPTFDLQTCQRANVKTTEVVTTFTFDV